MPGPISVSSALVVLSLLLVTSLSTFASTNGACGRLEQLRLGMEVAAANIVNADTTRTPEGGPYKVRKLKCTKNTCEVKEELKVRKSYQPEHPDADEDGYVLYPKVSLTTEKAKMNRLTRQYESAAQHCQR